MEEKEDKKLKASKKVGFKTLGITLIAFGILFFVDVIFGVDVLRYMLIIWPVVFVSLGLEILIMDTKRDIKISVGSIFLIMFLIITSFVFGAANVCINEVLYNEEFLESLAGNESLYYIDKDEEFVNISNYSGKNVSLKIIEKDVEYPRVYTSVEYELSKGKNNISKIISYMNDEGYDIVSKEDGLEIYNVSNMVKQLNVRIIVDDASKVKVTGDISIIEN